MQINSKTRLLYLIKFLYERTDEDHTVTTKDIENYFAELGSVVDRKTVSSDITALQRFGLDIVVSREAQNRYSVGERLFELPELKLLADAVEASKFITAKKSAELVEKLGNLTSRYHSEDLIRHLYIADRVKPENENIYYTVDGIHTAVNQKKQISFRYFEYNVERKKIYKNDGQRYLFSPYGLMWNEDHYYAVGYSDKHGKIVTFRVDRIVELDIMEEAAVPQPDDFSLPDFAREVFDMYDGTPETVTLYCKNEMMKVILDRFGEAVETVPLDEQRFRARAEVSVSRTFFGWLFQFCGDIELVGPENVVEQYRNMLDAARK